MKAHARRLYRLLETAFPSVQVVPKRVGPPQPGHHRAGKRIQVSRGEVWFLVDCPFCCGTLCIDDRYGDYDPVTQTDNLGLAFCQKRNCFSDLGNQMELHYWIFGHPATSYLPSFLSGPGDLPVSTASLPAVSPPGRIIPIDQLQPMHPTVRYLTYRGYDLDELATIWGVAYYAESHPRMMRGRIYIPIFQDGILVGWQGRWPADLNWKQFDFPKYYTSPGLKKSQLLYNQDLAGQQPFVVVCEGVSDVWRVGPAGVALLGKTASREQLRLLAAGWRGKPAVVLLDADAAWEARILYEQLHPFFERRLVLAILPEGLDPGQCPRSDLWSFLRRTAQGQGVELPLGEAMNV